MKNNIIFGLILILLLTVSCNEDLIYIKNADSYSTLYIPQAVDNPRIANIFVIENQVQTFSINAFYGGAITPKKDIQITFKVDPACVDSFNIKNGTDYTILPEAVYEFDKMNATVLAGNSASDFIKLSIKTNSDFEVFQSYLLPVTMDANDVTINQDLKTVYFLITGSYAPGNVPRTKLFQLEKDYISLFEYQGNIIEHSKSGEIIAFPYVQESNSFSPGITINSGGWELFHSIITIHDHLVGLSRTTGDLIKYPIKGLTILPGIEFGFGFGAHFDMILPYKNAILCRKPIANGAELVKYPLSPDMTWGWPYPSLGGGWNFNNIIPYTDCLLAIEDNGDMWRYPLTDDGVLGSRTKVGSGWNMYKKVFPYKTDLIAVDNDNVLWLYKFNLRGFWALK